MFGSALALTIAALVTTEGAIVTIVLVTEALLLVLSFGAAVVNTRKITKDPVARAQALWLLFGFALCIIPLLVFYLLDYTGVLDLDRLNVFYGAFISLVLPVCLAIAITRYHLFDIYLIIRRTVQYSLLTLLLALIYFTIIILLQSLFTSLTGQGQNAAIIISTLAIAVLFNPLRLRIQKFIDRRFFRSGYDAPKILASFAATTRREVDLNSLTLALVVSVENPSSLSRSTYGSGQTVSNIS